MTETMITIVGGGPAGLRTAEKLAFEGWEVKVLEEHPQIGVPTHCSGLVSRSGVKELGIDLEDIVLNVVKGAKIFSPDNSMLEVKRKDFVAFVVDRAKFDKLLAKKAQNAGAEILTQAQLLDVKGEKIFIKKENRGEMLKTRFLVGADGVNSKVRELMGITVPKENFIHSIQIRAKGSFNPDFVEMHIGNFAPNYFAWIIPENKETAKIGFGTNLGANVKEKFQEFIEAKNLQIDQFEIDSSLIPYGDPLSPLFKDNMFLVGDAAFHCKKTTGGGILFGMMAGDVLSKTISDHLKHKTPLEKYEKNLSRIHRELKLHSKIRNFFNSLSNEEINKLIKKLVQLRVQDYLSEKGDMEFLTKFIPQMLRNPHYITLFPQVIKFMMS